MGSCFRNKKDSLFMVKVKTVFCILCVCNPLFTSQHSLSWDTRLWPLLGGTTQTQWFSNINHEEVCFLIKFTTVFPLLCHYTMPHLRHLPPLDKNAQSRSTLWASPSDDTRLNEAWSNDARGGHNARC